MLRGLVKLVAGGGLAQLIGFLAAPLLTRVFTPADFGVFGVFSAVLSVVGNASSLRYDTAIPLPKNRERALDLLGLSLLVAIVIACFTTVGAVVFWYSAARVFSLPMFSDIFLWLPFSVFGFSALQVYSAWASREGMVGAISLSQIARAVVVAAAQLLGGVAGMGAAGLVIGQAVGQVVAVVFLVQRFGRDTAEVAFHRPTLNRMADVAREYSSFPKHGAPQAVVNSISQMLLALLLGALFSPVSAGFYVLAQRVVLAPVQLIATAFRQMLTPRFAQQIHDGQPVARLFAKTTFGLAVVGLPGVLVVFVGGEDIFQFIFGSEWREAGKYAGILVFALWLDMIIPPATIVLTVLHKQKFQLLFEVAIMMARASAIFVGYWGDSALLAVTLFSAVSFLMNGLLVMAGLYFSTRSDRTFRRSGEIC